MAHSDSFIADRAALVRIANLPSDTSFPPDLDAAVPHLERWGWIVVVDSTDGNYVEITKAGRAILSDRLPPRSDMVAGDRSKLVAWLEWRARGEDLLALSERDSGRPAFEKDHKNEAKRYRAVIALLQQEAPSPTHGEKA